PHFGLSFQKCLPLVAGGAGNEQTAILATERPGFHGHFAFPVGTNNGHLHFRLVGVPLHLVVSFLYNLRSCLSRRGEVDEYKYDDNNPFHSDVVFLQYLLTRKSSRSSIGYVPFITTY